VVAGPRRVTAEPRLALTPIAVGIWLEGEEPSDPTGALGRKRHRGASPSVRNRSARGHRYTPTKGSNPVSRDVAADCLRRADGPPTQGERRAPARLTFSARAAWFPLVQTATRRRSSRGVDSVCGLGGWEAPGRSTRRPAQDLRGWLEFAWSRAREPLSFDDVIEGSVTGLDGQYPKDSESCSKVSPTESCASRSVVNRLPVGCQNSVHTPELT
jgi:hypothetical protein